MKKRRDETRGEEKLKLDNISERETERKKRGENIRTEETR